MRDRHVHRKLHKHGRRSYLSVGTFGDSQSLLEREPLRSKDRGLFSYNIDIDNCTCACVMAERRCSAHADVEQSDGARYQ